MASNDPGRAYAKIPRGDGHGYRTITAVQLATAVSQAAWWLDKHLAPHSSLAKVVGYIGPQDLRYVALALGAVKTGRQVSLIDFSSSTLEVTNWPSKAVPPGPGQRCRSQCGAVGCLRLFRCPNGRRPKVPRHHQLAVGKTKSDACSGCGICLLF